MPATMPGMLVTLGPSGDVRVPLALKILALSPVAWLGVMSLKSMAIGSDMPLRKSRHIPSPPMLDASGSVTPRAKSTAMAASTMLPPRARISAPARDAYALPDVITARVPVAPCLMSGCSATILSITSSAAFASLAAIAGPRYFVRSASHCVAAGPLP